MYYSLYIFKMVPSREICYEKLQWIPEGFEFPDSVGLVVFSFCIKMSLSSYTQQQLLSTFRRHLKPHLFKEYLG
jgi:hypothetical protein